MIFLVYPSHALFIRLRACKRDIVRLKLAWRRAEVLQLRFCERLFSGLVNAGAVLEPSTFCPLCVEGFLLQNEISQAGFVSGLAR